MKKPPELLSNLLAVSLAAQRSHDPDNATSFGEVSTVGSLTNSSRFASTGNGRLVSSRAASGLLLGSRRHFQRFRHLARPCRGGWSSPGAQPSRCRGLLLTGCLAFTGCAYAAVVA